MDDRSGRETLDAPRDPVVYLVWRAWRAIKSRLEPVATNVEISVMGLHVNLFTDQHYAMRAKATADPDPDEPSIRREVAVPEPITWTSSDSSVVELDQEHGTSTTIYGKSPGEVTITVTCGPNNLTDTAIIKVSERVATLVSIVPWEEDPVDPTSRT